MSVQQPVRSAASIAALTVSILASFFALIGGVALPVILGTVAAGLATWGLILGLLSVVYELLRLFAH